MIDITNNTNLPLNQNILIEIAKRLTNKDIELLIVNEDEMLTINSTQRDIKKSTDVLSFPYESMPMAPLGSIVICDQYVTTYANEYGHSKQDEFNLLFIHGILHLLGYDHEKDTGEMRNKEEKLIEVFNLPKSLIVRTQG